MLGGGPTFAIMFATWNLHFLSDGHAIVSADAKACVVASLVGTLCLRGWNAGGRWRFDAHVPPSSAGSALGVPSGARHSSYRSADLTPH